MEDRPVTISEAPTEIRDAGRLMSEGRKTVRSLWNLSPYQIVWTERGFKVTLDYTGDPDSEDAVVKHIEDLNLSNQ